MPDLVSIIIPVYNKEDTLERCLKSVLEINYSSIEVILVDDGSTDSSGIICDSFKKHNNFIIKHQANLGVSAARNEGLHLATGKYVSFIDADDTVEPNYISSLIYQMNDDVDIVVGAGHRINRRYRKELNIKDGIKYMFLDDNFGVNVWGKLYRSSVINNNPFPIGIKMGEDMKMLFDTILNAHKVIYLSECNYNQMTSNNNSYSLSSIDDFYKAIGIVDEFINRANKETYLTEIIKILQIAKARRYIWLVNIMSLRHTIINDYLKESSIYLKQNWTILSDFKYKVAAFFIAYMPNFYCKIFTMLERND